MLPSPPASPPISPARLHKLVISQSDPLLALELVTVTAPTTAPHPSTLHALVLRLSRRREQLPHALALLRRLPSPNSPRILLPLLLSALRLRRQPHLFLSTFNSLFISGLSPLPLHPQLLLRLLSVLSSTASYFPCALHLLRDVSTRLLLPEPLVLASHNLLIEAAARSGHLAVSISSSIASADCIARVTHEDGLVVGWIFLHELRQHLWNSGNTEIDVLNGIAWDEENRRLFVTGKLWPKLYEIKLRPVDGPQDGSVEKLCPKASFYH